MEEISEKTEQSQKSSFWRGFWVSGVFGFSSSIFREFFSLPVAWFFAGMITSCISYITLPKPRIGILRYFAFTQIALLVIFLVIWVVPPFFQRFMPTLWAYALPVLLLGNVIYFVPPLDGNPRDTAWWKWFLGSLIFAGLFGWILSSLEK